MKIVRHSTMGLSHKNCKQMHKKKEQNYIDENCEISQTIEQNV